MRLLCLLRAAAADDCGVTSIEYAFIASLIAIAATAAYATIGSNLSAVFNDVANGF